MTDREHSKDLSQSDMQIRPSEDEIIQLLQKAAQEYEECIILTDLSDYPEVAESSHPEYSWDNPVGLVVTQRSHVDLV